MRSTGNATPFQPSGNCNGASSDEMSDNDNGVFAAIPIRVVALVGMSAMASSAMIASGRSTLCVFASVRDSPARSVRLATSTETRDAHWCFSVLACLAMMPMTMPITTDTPRAKNSCDVRFVCNV